MSQENAGQEFKGEANFWPRNVDRLHNAASSCYAPTVIDWQFIIDLEKDTNLSSVFPDAISRGENFYQVGSDAYVSTWHTSNQKIGSGPFITGAAWAASVGVARRILCRDRNVDDGAVGTLPEALLLEPGCKTYAQIKCAAESGRFGLFRCPDASLCHPAYGYVIAVGERLTYYFKSPNDPPYAIWIDCRDIRWSLCG